MPKWANKYTSVAILLPASKAEEGVDGKSNA